MHSLVFLSKRHELLAKEIEPNSVVLDVGCGVGLLTSILALKRCRVHGADILEDNLRIAQRLSRMLNVDELCTFHKVEANRLPFNAESFDFVTISWTLHDIKEEEQPILLSECLRVLKLKGKLLILDPETRLDFKQVDNTLAKLHATKTKEKVMATIYDHGVTRAILVEYEK